MYRDQAQRDFARTLRSNPTEAEKRLWHFLRAQKLHGYKFRRQAAIGSYIVDFVCFASKLIVELDGPQHVDPAAIEYDKGRTDWLSSRGFHVLRFRNQDLDENIDAVVDAIAGALTKLQPRGDSPSPTLPAEGRESNQIQSDAARQVTGPG